MPHATALPPFPDGLEETHLTRLPLSALLSGDAATASALLDICTSHGFFYLDLTESEIGKRLLASAESLHGLAVEAFKLPQDAKQAVHQSVTESIFGWKASGAVAAADPYGRSDRGEFWNISKDDILDNEGRKNVPYPPTINQQKPLIESFMRDAHSIGVHVLESLAAQLGIAAGEMQRRHRISQPAGDHVRLTWGPGDAAGTSDEGKPEADTRITTYAHTDFGSVTLLFNWLGGLQIEDRSSGAWRWVRPLSGHAICNLGDAMVEFSAGRLASGKHRVVAAPGAQAVLERYSIVYFVRPEDAVVMEDLTGGSDGSGGVTNGRKYTAGEWIRKRVLAMGNPIDAGSKK